MNTQLKKRLHSKQLGDYTNHENATSRTLAEMRNDPFFVEVLKKRDKGIRRGLKRVVSRDGGITSHSLAKSRNEVEEKK